METKNKMIQFQENNRTTTFFRELAITEIRIAYRIMEYLEPDDVFKPDINDVTKTLIMSECFEDAYKHIEEEINHNIDTGSSWGNEGLKSDAIELMKKLLPLYKARQNFIKEGKRKKLLEELSNLDKE